MRPILKTMLTVIFMCPTALMAQLVVAPNDRLGAIVASSKSGSDLTLSGSKYTANINVQGKSLSILGKSEARTTIVAGTGTSVVSVGKTAALFMDNVRLVGSNKKQAGIYLKGGTLKLSNSVIEGPFSFGIYATAGSKIELINVIIKNGEHAIYVRGQADLIVRNSQFINLSDSAITLFGARTRATLSGIKIDRVGVSAIALRDGAFSSLKSSSITGAKNHGIYLDKQAAIALDDVIINDVDHGILALGAGDILVKNLKINSYRKSGITAQSAKTLIAKRLQIEGSGPGVSATGHLPKIEIDIAHLRNNNQKRSTVFIGNNGSVDIAHLSTEGGYAGVYIKGTRSAKTQLRSSKIFGGRFAGVVLQGTKTVKKMFAPVLDEVEIFNTGSGLALALDNVPFAIVKNTSLLATKQPSLSAYKSGRIDLEKSIIATGSKKWLRGRINHNASIPSRANIIETGLEFDASTLPELLQRLVQKQQLATKSAKLLGTVYAVNDTGLELNGNVVDIALMDETGKITKVSSDGKPREIPSGVYDVRINGFKSDPLKVTPNSPTIISIPQPRHPYFLFKKGKKKYLRGRKMELLDRKTLQRNYLARGLITQKSTFWTKSSFGYARSELSVEDRSRLLKNARLIYFNALADAHKSALNNSKTSEERQVRQVARYSGAVISALGSIEDRDRILEHLPKERSYPRATSIEIAAFIEARLGIVRHSRVFDLAKKIALDNPVLAMRLATSAAVVGNVDAVNYLIEKMTRGDFKVDALSGNEAHVILSVLARSRDPRILRFFRHILADYREMIAVMIKQEANKRYKSKNGYNYWVSLPMIMEYIGAWGVESDRSLLAVPIAGDFALSSDISAIVKEPVPIYLDQTGVLPRPVPVKVYWRSVPSFGVTICRGLERRSKKDRQEILKTYKTMTGSHLNKALYGMAARKNWIVGEAITQITSSYCNPNTRLAGALRRRPDDLEVFAKGDQTLPWVDRPMKARQNLAKFKPDGWSINTMALSQMSVAEITMATKDDPRFKTNAGKALLLNHRALSYRYQEPRPDIYQNGADRRLFASSPAWTKGETILVGRVDMKPIISNGLLRIGLRLRVSYDDKGFLTPQMTGRDKAMAKALASASFGFIKAVKLRRADHSVAMKFEKSSKSGTHIYSIPFDSKSLAELSIQVELGAIKHTWKLDYPLFIGDFAFRHRTSLP